MICLGLGKLIMGIRKRYGYTVTYVSECTGIAQETIRRIENDKFEPKLSTLNILSDFYRIDLVELYARKRSVLSFFSEELISNVNDYVAKTDYVGLKEYASAVVKDLKKDELDQKRILINFLFSIQNIRYKPTNNQKDTISNVESLLLSLNNSYWKEDIFNYPYPIEVTCIIYLAVLYRQTKENEKAILLIEMTISRIKKMPYLNDRYIDFLGTLYMNLSYCYHEIKEDQKVIDTVDEALMDQTLSFTGYLTFSFLFRKAIAMFRLNKEDYYAVLTGALYLIDSNRRKVICDILIKEYGIKHHLRNQ